MISGLGITGGGVRHQRTSYRSGSAGPATTVTFTGSTDSIRLLGVTAANVNQSDFKFAP